MIDLNIYREHFKIFSFKHALNTLHVYIGLNENETLQKIAGNRFRYLLIPLSSSQRLCDSLNKLFQSIGVIVTRMSFEKFRILLWKNWTIQKRHWKSGIFEVIFPVLLIVLFTWVRHESIKFETDNKSTVVSSDYDLSYPCMINGRNATNIYYSPTSEWLDLFVQRTFNIDGRIEIESFATSQELDEYLNQNRTTEDLMFGLEFQDSLLVSLKIFQDIFKAILLVGFNKSTGISQLHNQIASTKLLHQLLLFSTHE